MKATQRDFAAVAPRAARQAPRTVPGSWISIVVSLMQNFWPSVWCTSFRMRSSIRYGAKSCVSLITLTRV